jgi:hypothetical protein
MALLTRSASFCTSCRRHKESAGIGMCRQPCCGGAFVSTSISVQKTCQRYWREWARASECLSALSKLRYCVIDLVEKTKASRSQTCDTDVATRAARKADPSHASGPPVSSEGKNSNSSTSRRILSPGPNGLREARAETRLHCDESHKPGQKASLRVVVGRPLCHDLSRLFANIGNLSCQ